MTRALVSALLILVPAVVRPEEPPGAVSTAIAVLEPTKGNKAHGAVTFTRAGGKLSVVADVSGLSPGEHGFHVHEFGDCSAADASSAGGHFNPKGMPHAGPAEAARHAGDLGNVKADAQGKARLETTTDALSLAPGDTLALGRSVIVHEKADDLHTQPTGNAGNRVACGVIGVAKPPETH